MVLELVIKFSPAAKAAFGGFLRPLRKKQP